jgi:hypothetical protein
MSPISSVLKLSTNDSAIAVGELAPVGLTKTVAESLKPEGSPDARVGLDDRQSPVEDRSDL